MRAHEEADRTLVVTYDSTRLSGCLFVLARVLTPLTEARQRVDALRGST